MGLCSASVSSKPWKHLPWQMYKVFQRVSWTNESSGNILWHGVDSCASGKVWTEDPRRRGSLIPQVLAHSSGVLSVGPFCDGILDFLGIICLALRIAVCFSFLSWEPNCNIYELTPNYCPDFLLSQREKASEIGTYPKSSTTSVLYKSGISF